MSTGKVSIINSAVPSLLSIVYKFGDWLITLLQLYVLINSAMVGWILTTKPSWQIAQKLIVTIVYSLAMCINFVWMFRLHDWLNNVVNEIQKVITGVEFASLSKTFTLLSLRCSKEGGGTCSSRFIWFLTYW